jgi:hypothetical protein
MDFSDQVFSVDELAKIFISDYPHSIPLTWFDMEMKNSLNIDVYDYDFPKKEGYLYLAKESLELLIMKCEIPDSTKEHVLSDFLNINNFSLKRNNTAQNKDYYKVYQKFIKRINLPRSYIDMMCDSKYMNHFYEYSEIAETRSKWLASGNS